MHNAFPRVWDLATGTQPRMLIDARTSYARGMVSLISNTYGNSLPIFNAQIPYSVRASEISALGCSIYVHNAKGKVARAYEKLVQEVIGHGI